ncbi:hypothetical protein RRG08_025029 [Elysia crispata]|uniref:Uncharacterized protein n=1 Tax=Elysia crispata TaxID=231223 RepID=A0AAE1E2I5_9GAST|nr:hypothetical protein RRG08_025029 [Elysia crispata]
MMGNYKPQRKPCKMRSQAVIVNARQNSQLIRPPTADYEPGHSTCTLENLPLWKRRACVYRHPRRVQSSLQYPTCDVGLCAKCFALYHLEKNRPMK